MNKLSNYCLMLLMSATVIFVSSCGDDTEDILPFGSSTIDGFQVGGADTTGVTAEPGETITLSVAFDLEEGAEVSLIGFIGDSIADPATPLTSTSINPLQTSFDVPEDASEDFVVTYELQDADGNTVDSDDFSVTLEVDEDAETYSAVLLEAPLGQDPGERTSNTFFSATDGMTYSVEDVVAGTDGISSADIHFGYYFGATNEASLASPADYPSDVYNLGPDGANWGTLNETMFRPINAERFEEATTSSEVTGEFEVANSADESQEITGLEEGDTYAFSYTEGEETKFGVFRVDDIVEGIESTGQITLTVKVEASED